MCRNLVMTIAIAEYGTILLYIWIFLLSCPQAQQFSCNSGNKFDRRTLRAAFERVVSDCEQFACLLLGNPWYMIGYGSLITLASSAHTTWDCFNVGSMPCLMELFLYRRTISYNTVVFFTLFLFLFMQIPALCSKIAIFFLWSVKKTFRQQDIVNETIVSFIVHLVR